MHPLWPAVARRIVQGVGARPGELVQVRGDAGRADVFQELLLAVELAGATPLPELIAPDYLERLWAGAPADYLAAWDRHRRPWLAQVDRVITLHGGEPDRGGAQAAGHAAWRQAVERLLAVEEDRRLPVLVAAMPTERRARQLSLSLDELEAAVLPAMAAPAEELRREIERVLHFAGGRVVTIRSGGRHELTLERGGRTWLADDGEIDAADRAAGAVVSNLPAGSIYSTVVEDRTQGSLWLPQAGPATDVVFHFEQGRIVSIDAAANAAALSDWLDSHTGEPRRVSHIGLALNPHLRAPIGWTLIDEHVHGALFLALGENRYMGGQNASSLNVDYALLDADLACDGRPVVVQGKVVV